jgi:hypothetical protein
MSEREETTPTEDAAPDEGTADTAGDDEQSERAEK